MKEFSLFVSILDHALPHGRHQLEPFGLAGVVSFQSIAEALLVSGCLLALFTFSSKLEASFGLCAVNALTHLTILLVKCFLDFFRLVSSAVCFEPTHIILVDCG